MPFQLDALDAFTYDTGVIHTWLNTDIHVYLYILYVSRTEYCTVHTYDIKQRRNSFLQPDFHWVYLLTYLLTYLFIIITEALWNNPESIPKRSKTEDRPGRPRLPGSQPPNGIKSSKLTIQAVSQAVVGSAITNIIWDLQLTKLSYYDTCMYTSFRTLTTDTQRRTFIKIGWMPP